MLYFSRVVARCVVMVSCLYVSTLSHATVIEKGQVDDREYHYFVLKNQLKVLLISDETADKAAASLDVNVGSSHDPKDREGLAHFLEHMLFLGTKKYPDAAEYQAFIDQHAGGHNAYTSPEHTNYFFDIDANKLEPALDRFSQFFISPLFDANYVDRERNAVHSEYQAKIKDDSRREYDVFRTLLNPKHPYAKFSVGSLTTLANRPDDNVRDDLLDFYAKHYSSDKMTLVVLGKESIADLKRMVKQRFSQVPQRSVKDQDITTPLFTEKTLPIEVLYEPVKDVRQMEMIFPLPSVKKYYDKKPLNYLGFLLGHEGKGSLLSLLKEQGWAEGLSAGGGDIGAGNATFAINITLTEDGIKQRERIRALVFHALHVIRTQGIEKWRFLEEQQLANISFQYREKGRATSTVSRLSNQLHDYPAAEVISGAYLYKTFDPQLIDALLQKMTPDNLYVSTTYPDVMTNKTTHYYRVPYRVTPLSTTLVDIDSAFKKRYQLPKENIFVPESSRLKAQDANLNRISALSSNNSAVELWAKQDISFLVPRANVTVRVQSPLIASSLHHASMNLLLLSMINDNLNENSYPALIAGLSYSLSTNSRGFDLQVSGYDDKITQLLSMVQAQLVNPVLTEKRFVSIKKELMRHLSNTEQLTPFRQLFKALPVTLYSPYYSDAEKMQALEKISLKDVQAFAQQWLKGATVKGLLYGNLDKMKVAQWQQAIESIVLAGDQVMTPATVVKRPFNTAKKPDIQTRSLVVDHNDKAVTLYVQGVSDTLEAKAKMVLLRQVLESSFYSQLRTEQQLGYIVFLTGMPFKEVPGSVFVVQSPSASVTAIQQAMQTFIAESIHAIPDDLSSYQQSAATKLLQKSQSLSDESGVYWQNILKDDETFSYRQRLVSAIHQVTKEQLHEYYQQTLLDPQSLLWFTAERDTTESYPVFGASSYQYP